MQILKSCKTSKAYTSITYAEINVCKQLTVVQWKMKWPAYRLPSRVMKKTQQFVLLRWLHTMLFHTPPWHHFTPLSQCHQYVKCMNNLFLPQMSAGLRQFSQQGSCLWSPWIPEHYKVTHNTSAEHSNNTAYITDKKHTVNSSQNKQIISLRPLTILNLTALNTNHSLNFSMQA